MDKVAATTAVHRDQSLDDELLDALAEHLPRYRDAHPDAPPFPGLDAYPDANKPG